MNYHEKPTSYPEAYSKHRADNSIPDVAITLPTNDVFLIPYLSVSIADTGESKNVAPTAADPTSEANIPATSSSGLSAFSFFSSATNTVPKEFVIPNIIPLHKKLHNTTNHAYVGRKQINIRNK